MALALLFSGQGMQHPDMLPWLNAEQPLLQAMQTGLGVACWRTALHDAAWASANAHAQVLLTATALAAWTQLQAAMPPACRLAVVAGYSVGELAAGSVAGLFDAATALRLARRRAEAMDAAAAGRDLGMLAISGLALARIDALCAATGNALAIRNAPDSAVCAGLRPGLAPLQRRAEAEGAHCTPLAVRTASHTHWMDEAAARFADELARTPIAAPSLPWACNTGVLARDAAAARQALAQQIANTVAWQTCMEHIHERRPAAVLEIGPGRGLAAMWNRQYPEVPARSADEFRSQSALQRWLAKVC